MEIRLSADNAWLTAKDEIFLEPKYNETAET